MMVARYTEEAYESNIRSLISAVDHRGRRDDRVAGTEDSLALHLVGSLAWQEAERRRLMREHGVYSVQAAVTSAYRDLWSLAERLAKINDDQESETGKQLHMDMTNLADLEWAYQSLPSNKLRLLWDWCVVGRERRIFSDERYQFVYFLERSDPVMYRGKQRPVYRCVPRSPLAAAKGLRALDIPASVEDVAGWLELATENIVQTLCHEGVLQKDGSRP